MSDTQTFYQVEYQSISKCPVTDDWFECRMFGIEQDAIDFKKGMEPHFKNTRYRIVKVNHPQAIEEEKTHADT